MPWVSRQRAIYLPEHSWNLHDPCDCTNSRHKGGGWSCANSSASESPPSRHPKHGHCNVLCLSHLDLQSGCQQLSSGRRWSLQHENRAKINTLKDWERQKIQVVIWASPKAVTAAAGEGGSETLGKGGDRRKSCSVSAVCKYVPEGHSWVEDGELRVNKVLARNKSDGFRYPPVSVVESQGQENVMCMGAGTLCSTAGGQARARSSRAL